VRFQVAHKLVTYLLVLAALAAVATTRALPATSAALFLAACLLSFRIDPGNRAALALDRAAKPLRAAAGLLFAFILFRVWRRLPDPDIAPAFDLVLALLGYKLFFRRAHRDHVHIAALTFLLVLIASTIASTFVFVAAFAVYVVLAVWALILFHLRREMEENYLIKHSAQAPSQKVGVGRILGSRRVVGGSFFVATAGMAVAVLVGAVAIFMLVPRVGAGFSLGVARMSGSAVGFADEIAVGRYGTRAAHRAGVTLRATLPHLTALDEPARRQAAEELYFRGAVYDSYERGRWRHGRGAELRTQVDFDGTRFWIGEPDGTGGGARTLDATVRQEIEAIGIPASVLLAVDRPRALELPAASLGAAGTLRVFPRWSGEAALRVGEGDGNTFITLSHAHYAAYSDLGAAVPPGRTAALSPAARLDYLAVPDDVASRIAALGAKLVAAAPDDAGKVAAIRQGLRAGHGYTRDPQPPPPGVDPVEHFLLGERAGHCELFASAAVLLLRVTGVPARYVTGFRGGDWNSVGGYVAVRDDRAHAWAEAFLPDAGWVRVDATPAGPAPAGAGRVAQFMDALDYLWNRWVVGYDLGRQLELARRAGRHLGPATPRGPSLVTWLLAFAGIVAAVVVALVARRLWRRRGRVARDVRPAPAGAHWTAPPIGPVDRLYRKTLARLARAGWPRHPSETPREYAHRVRAAGLVPGDGFDRLTDRYAAARFGGHPVDAGDVAELSAKLAIRPAVAGHPGSAGTSASR
jgi:transglutaminase-like putative cysteine protease